MREGKKPMEEGLRIGFSKMERDEDGERVREVS